MRAEFLDILRFWLDRGRGRLPRRRRARPGQGRPACPTGTSRRRPAPAARDQRRPPMWDQDGRARDLPRAGARCSTTTRASGSWSPRRGCSRPSGSPPTSVPTRCTRPSTSTTSRPPGPPPTCARSIDRLAGRRRLGRRADHLGAVQPRRGPARLPARPAGGTARPNGIGIGDPQPDAELGLRRARAATPADAGAARLGLPLPGRGAGAAGAHDAARRGPPGPDLGAQRPHRDAAATAAGCRSRGRPTRRRTASGRPGASWLPQPGGLGRVRARPRSATCPARRTRCTGRRCGCAATWGWAAAPWSGWSPADEVLFFRNGPVRVLTNFGAEAVPLPEGAELLHASGAARHRRQRADRRHGLAARLSAADRPPETAA